MEAIRDLEEPNEPEETEHPEAEEYHLSILREIEHKNSYNNLFQDVERALRSASEGSPGENSVKNGELNSKIREIF